MERREHSRISLLSRIDLTSINPGDSITGHAINISKGGIALYADRAFDINTELLLTIYFQCDDGKKKENITGTLRWIKPVEDRFALGLQFKGLQRETHPVIFLYLELN